MFKAYLSIASFNNYEFKFFVNIFLKHFVTIIILLIRLTRAFKKKLNYFFKIKYLKFFNKNLDVRIWIVGIRLVMLISMSKSNNISFLDTGYYDENEYGEPSRNYNSNVCSYIYML